MIKKVGISVFLLQLIFNICSAPNLSYAVRENELKITDTGITDLNRKKEFERWKKDLGLAESSGDWTRYNTIGCIGMYQFQIATLEFLGFTGITFEKFKEDPSIFPPELQDKALLQLVSLNENSLLDFEKYLGLTIGGIPISRSGLLAAAHLGGMEGVRSFLVDNEDKKDMNGTLITEYLIKFQGYGF